MSPEKDRDEMAVQTAKETLLNFMAIMFHRRSSDPFPSEEAKAAVERLIEAVTDEVQWRWAREI